MMVILIANGYVSQRYPNYDYEDVPFPNLDLFCQSNGWKLTFSIRTRSKVYRCISDKAAMVANDHVTSK